MAIEIKNNKIKMYEGDTGEFPVYLEGELEEGDILQFRIKENLDDTTTLYSNDYEADNEVMIVINSAVSSKLSNDTTGDKTYYYGFKLIRGSDTDTILGVGEYIIKKGV